MRWGVRSPLSRGLFHPANKRTQEELDQTALADFDLRGKCHSRRQRNGFASNPNVGTLEGNIGGVAPAQLLIVDRVLL